MNKNVAYCTVFDLNYLAKGIALAKSLLNVNQVVMLYIFCLDQVTYEVLVKLKLANIIPIQNMQFECELLNKLKKTRSNAEYCWTCKPFIIDYLFKNIRIDWVVYVDADTFFFSDPAQIIPNYGEWQITPHNFSSDFISYKDSVGIFNAGYFAAKNSTIGRAAISEWRKMCVDECSAIPTDKGYGDQKYLEVLAMRYPNVDANPTIGLNVAPWNIKNYIVSVDEFGAIKVNNINLILFHFQGLKHLEEGVYDLYSGKFSLGNAIIKIIYMPYLKIINQAHGEVDEVLKLLKIKKNKLSNGGFILNIKFLLRSIKYKNIIKIKNGTPL